MAGRPVQAVDEMRLSVLGKDPIVPNAGVVNLKSELVLK